ncbi:AAA family ATPase [Clostridium gasigenes]|uniref:ParA family protein n=1 Tax=Clostridium gasigenes TaxID=94869 RepID=UPI001C0B3608|nr:AAA family ATPase [Clostridium gasigenes]MBU3135806.1 AAA family ATPase [Clostridium gasigenes]
MAKIIATINLKGGVAKTTTTVGLAETLACEFDKRVLVIDLDPQTNATTMLIQEEKWRELNNKELTTARLFKDSKLAMNERKFDLRNTIQYGVSSIDKVKKLDLLPSSLELIEIQDNLTSIYRGRFNAITPVDILKRAINEVVDNYDYILIDCPPNLGTITLNGLRISDGYIIPTIPDVLSTYGIPQVVKWISEFSSEIDKEIKPIGIVITKYSSNSSVHKTTIKELELERDVKLFKTKFIQCNDLAKAAEYTEVNTLAKKWGYGEKHYDLFIEFAKEFMGVCNDEFGV